MKPVFFENAYEFRVWLEENHEAHSEILVGYYKKATGLPSMTWPESVDQALCFGWIDGIRKSIDEYSYMIRFTPRKPRSIWSAVNIKKVDALKAKGLMHPKGLAAFKQKDENKLKVYSFEQKKENIKLPPAYVKQFKAHKKAWSYFHSSAPSYQKTAIWWVISAKQETTRRRRLETLIEDSANGIKIKPLRR